MKKNNWLLFILMPFFLGSCEDDEIITEGNGGEAVDRPETLAWIEDVMRENYFWYGEIPATNSLNYNAGEEAFFYSLLSNNDGKTINNTHYYFSYIENTGNARSTIQENYSYGIEFTGILFSETQIGVLILYVVPESPAERAGLQRGDWILEMDGKEITTNNEYESLLGGPAKTLTVARWEPSVTNPNTGSWVDKREVKLEAAEVVVDNPVYIYKTYQRNGKTVGYLLYNHFTDGTDSNQEAYNDKLRDISTEFKNAGVDEVILDLRYNNGGTLTSAILLSAILAPQTALAETMGYLLYNDKQRPQEEFFTFNSMKLNHGVNLNLERVYVLTSSSTASSSEVVINSLSPFMDVIVIGDQTVGKNVGSTVYPNNNDPYPHGNGTTPWAIHPIICQISNTDKFTDYTDGFVPGTYNATHQGTPVSEGVYIDEAFEPSGVANEVYLTKIYPLGDENERMLKTALEVIDGTRLRSATAPVSSEKTYKIIPGRSIDRKASNGVVIDNQ